MPKLRMLIVDDEPEIREMLSRHFRFLDYDATVAGNGEEALAFMSDHKVDILITDIRMPVMDGIQLTRAVRERYPLVRILVVTGYVTLFNALECLRHGADGIFPKPLVDMAPLERAVARCSEIILEWTHQLALLNATKPEGGAPRE